MLSFCCGGSFALALQQLGRFLQFCQLGKHGVALSIAESKTLPSNSSERVHFRVKSIQGIVKLFDVAVDSNRNRLCSILVGSDLDSPGAFKNANRLLLGRIC